MLRSAFIDPLAVCKRLEETPKNAALRFMEWLVFEHSEMLGLQISMDEYGQKYNVEYGEIISQPISHLEFYNRGTYLESLLIESDYFRKTIYDLSDDTEAEINDRCKYGIADFLSVYVANRYAFNVDTKTIESDRYRFCINVQLECLNAFIHKSRQSTQESIRFGLEHFHRLHEN